MGQSIAERIERFVLPRAGDAADLQISLFQPEGDFAAGSLPIVFVTDADYLFATAAELVGMQSHSRVLAPAILVGIGYGRDIRTSAGLRQLDMALPIGAEARADPLMAAMADKAGGAEAFLGLLLGALSDEVARRCPAADPGHRILFGTSLGGLFATFALLSRPEAFRSLIIGSPAVFWDRGAVLRQVPAFTAKLKTLAPCPRVFIGVGGDEETVPAVPPPGSPLSLEEIRQGVALTRFVAGSYDLARTLGEAGVAEVVLKLFEGEGHQQVIPGLLNRGLRFALGTPR